MQEGDIWPNRTAEISIIFKPKEAKLYQQTIYCDVTGTGQPNIAVVKMNILLICVSNLLGCLLILKTIVERFARVYLSSSVI